MYDETYNYLCNKFINENISKEYKDYFINLYLCVNTFQYYWERQSKCEISAKINSFKHCLEDVIDLLMIDEKNYVNENKYCHDLLTFLCKTKIWIKYINLLDNIFDLPPEDGKIRGKQINIKIYRETLEKANESWKNIVNKLGYINNLGNIENELKIFELFV